MIVQSAPAGPQGRADEPRLVLTMQEHTATAGTLARHFGGSDGFDRLHPHDLVVDLVTEHDRGWVEVDAAAPRQPGSGLPWSIYQTPISISIATGPRSIDHNESRHPYRGLLSSMHIVGLHTGRYGLDREPMIDQMSRDAQALLEPMIAAERQRQDRLTDSLSADPDIAPWMGDALLRNYKALQFFDRLALWLQVTHPTGREATTIARVPTTGNDDTTVTVTPLDAERVLLDPFPLDTDPLTITIAGRWLAPQPEEVDLAAALASAPTAAQTVTLVGDPPS
jgi:hypothetical protein